MSFPGLIGHHRIQLLLERQLENDRLAHALLFVGADGIGRTTLAHSLIARLLNHTGALAAHPDYLEISRLEDEKTGKRKSKISVAQIRELTVRLGMTSLSGGWKVVFIEEADRLSMGAVNALLKTLEEPKGKTLLLLRAPSPETLPETILSRCQTLRFTQVGRDELVEGLVKMGLSSIDAQEAAAQSLGRPGRAIRFLKDSTFRSSHEAGLGQAIHFFSASLPEKLQQVLQIIPKSEADKDAALLSTIDSWELVCRDVLIRQLRLDHLLTFPHSESLDTLAQAMTQTTLLSIFSRLAQVRGAMKYNINSHLSLEHIALAL
jgi:DNA polymerase III subunit delta'